MNYFPDSSSALILLRSFHRLDSNKLSLPLVRLLQESYLDSKNFFHNLTSSVLNFQCHLLLPRSVILKLF